MAFIFETTNFIIEAVDKPVITRTDGGHITITPKVRILDRTKLSPRLAIEFIRLSMITGEAMTTALQQQGIDIGRINYQDNGNWAVFSPEGPFFHLHLYGRAKDAKFHKYGESCNLPLPSSGFYDQFEPLNQEDILAIQIQINLLLVSDRYTDPTWSL